MEQVTEHREEKQYHSRKRSLTDADIEEILVAFERRPIHHTCRFDGVTPEEFYESVRFYKNLNEGLTNSRNLVGKIVLGLLVTTFFGLLVTGFIVTIIGKIKSLAP